ncbi:MAG: RsiV family protein, partial [Bacteroidales bacterium]
YIQSYAFTGGAHGMFDARFLNFFRVDSKLFELAPFVQDTLALMDLARKEFCRQRALPLNATTEQTTLFVELADLPMPSLMGFTSKGLELAYAPYEIAPWSTGAITITLPMSSLKNVFKSNLKLFD